MNIYVGPGYNVKYPIFHRLYDAARCKSDRQISETSGEACLKMFPQCPAIFNTNFFAIFNNNKFIALLLPRCLPS